jgi:transcriptional regulator with XRE-family HTH domain
MSTVGENILLIRKQLGWTQEDLARRMGYKSKSTINKIEMGINDIPQSKIAKFAEVLGTTPAHLMGWSEDTKNSPPVIELTKGEKAILELIRQTPEAKNLFSLILSLTEDEVKQASDYLDYIISKRGK